MNGGGVESIVGLFVLYIYCDHYKFWDLIAARAENALRTQTKQNL